MAKSHADLGALTVERSTPSASSLRLPRRWVSRVLLPPRSSAGLQPPCFGLRGTLLRSRSKLSRPGSSADGQHRGPWAGAVPARMDGLSLFRDQPTCQFKRRECTA